MKLGIATRLTLWMAVLGCGAAGLTGYYAWDASCRLERQSAHSELLTSTQVLARRITLNLESIERNLQVIARLPVTRQLLEHDRPDDADRLAVLFAGVLDANPSYLQLRVIAADRHGLERVRVDRVGSVPQRVSGDDLEEKGHFPYVADALPLQDGAFYLSRISINHETSAGTGPGLPMLQMAIPVREHVGPALGVVVVNVDLNGLFRLLAADLPEDYQLYLANGAGDILIHPDASRAFAFDRGQRALLQDEFAQVAPLLSGDRTSAVIDAPEAERPAQIAAFVAQNIDSPANGDRLLLGLSEVESVALAQSTAMGWALLRIVGGTSLVALLGALLLGRALTRPLNAMAASARGFADGHEMKDLPLRRADELGSLARSLYELQAQVRRQLGELRHKQDELAHLSQHDSLTGLANRRLFMDRLEQALAQARRHGHRVFLLFIDLDDFKIINDRHGHSAGDEVLRVLAQRLQAQVRELDTVARLGGDEFVVLLGDAVDSAQASVVANKLLNALREPVPVAGLALVIDASIGVSNFPEDGQSASELLAHADRAMYAIKALGAGGVGFIGQVMPGDASGDVRSVPAG
jgi:diguanylate cyclase (GGDEF)-like protein